MDKLEGLLLLTGLTTISLVIAYLYVRPVAERYERKLRGAIEQMGLQGSHNRVLFVMTERSSRRKTIGAIIGFSMMLCVIILAHYVDRGVVTESIADLTMYALLILLLGATMPILFAFLIDRLGPSVIVATEDGVALTRPDRPNHVRSIRWNEVVSVKPDYYRNSDQILAIALKGTDGRIVIRTNWSNFDAFCRQLLLRVPHHAIDAGVIGLAVSMAGRSA